MNNLLAEYGWTADTEDDVEALNDLVHRVADELDGFLAPVTGDGSSIEADPMNAQRKGL